MDYATEFHKSFVKVSKGIDLNEKPCWFCEEKFTPDGLDYLAGSDGMKYFICLECQKTACAHKWMPDVANLEVCNKCDKMRRVQPLTCDRCGNKTDNYKQVGDESYSLCDTCTDDVG